MGHGLCTFGSRYPTLSNGSEVNGGISHMGSSEGKLEVGASSSGNPKPYKNANGTVSIQPITIV
jgi:hypothetical protein